MTLLTRCLFYVSIVVLFGCEESLPPRDDPQDVLTVSLSAGSGTFAFVDTSEAQHLWWLHWSADAFSIENVSFVFAVTNHYDEVLQGPAYLKGKIDVQVKDNPGVGSIEFEGGSASPPSLIQNGMLTLEPGDTLYVRVPWNHFYGPGLPVWKDYWNARSFLGKTTLPESNYTLGRFRMPPIDFEVTGSIQTFEKLPSITIEKVEWTAVYEVYLIFWP